ncbi:uncharacterized protein LOC120081142 [Benincasa hispida]|uniref:uncharacterized protein LOC120081142 n=1 Tax=Benincasa hispida TaxID=102211 RepID=UPI001902517A|nr:uncharacterized protein LOC120081142 [Benincasa hispida]
METFYGGLNRASQMAANAVAAGGLIDKSYTEAKEILDRIAKHNMEWVDDTHTFCSSGYDDQPSVEYNAGKRIKSTEGESGGNHQEHHPGANHQQTVPCSIGGLDVGHALCDLEANINLMPLSIFKKLGIGEAQPTSVTLQLADKTIKYSEGKIGDVLVKVDNFIFPTDFIILDYEADREVPIILERPFLATGKVLIDVHKGELTMRVDNEEVLALEENLKESEPPSLSEWWTKPMHPSLEEPPELELKQLPRHLKYAFLGTNNTLPVIISANLTEPNEQSLLQMLKKHKHAIGWTLADIRGISPSYCMHKIRLEEGKSGSIELQRRLNPIMKEVVKKEILKWLDAGVIYPISDSSWILIDPEDQEKTTFTCPFGTFAFRCMPFGLCNAPGIFQRCIMAIFSDFLEKTVEVFMDDFSVFGDSFQSCLDNLEVVLARCEETNLVLN